MAYQPNPNDPYRAGLSDDEIRRQARLNSLDNEIQPDPELAEGPASGAKIAMFAVAIAVGDGRRVLWPEQHQREPGRHHAAQPDRRRRSRPTPQRLRACVT